MEIIVLTLEETRGVAERVVSVLREVAWVADRAVVLGLSGDLGVGKTAFVQCVAEILGVTNTVTSPSYVLRSDYTTTDAVFRNLTHIDAYRLEDSSEVDTIGWDAVLAEPNTLVIVEWVDQVVDRVPADAFSMTVSVCDAERVFTTDILTGI